MNVRQWYTQTYFYKRALARSAGGGITFEQEAGADKVYSALCRAESNDYRKTGWHQDQEQPNTKISTQVQHSKQDYICCPEEDPSEPSNFKRLRDLRPVRKKNGKLVHYVLIV